MSHPTSPNKDLIPRALLAKFPYKPHPWTAAKWLSELESRHLGVTDWLDAWGWLPVVDAFEYGHRLERRVTVPVSHYLGHHLNMTAQEVAVHRLWQRGGRVVLEIHEGLTPHLLDSRSDKFPPMVLAHLVHRNPLVYLDKQLDLTDPTGKPVRLIGWYVAGMHNRQYLDTTDERATGFHFTTISEVLSDDRKEVQDWDFTRITLPVTGQDLTIDEIIEDGLSRFAWDPTLKGQKAVLQRQFITGLLRAIVPHMLYLTSQTLEAKPKPFTVPAPPRRNAWERKRGGGPVDRQIVGWQSGPVLASLERWNGEEVEPRGPRGPQGSRKSPRPHMRRPHFHTYWAGKGSKGMTPEERAERAEKRVKWLPPIPINTSAGQPGTTVVKIK